MKANTREKRFNLRAQQERNSVSCVRKWLKSKFSSSCRCRFPPLTATQFQKSSLSCIQKFNLLSTIHQDFKYRLIFIVSAGKRQKREVLINFRVPSVSLLFHLAIVMNAAKNTKQFRIRTGSTFVCASHSFRIYTHEGIFSVSSC